MLRFAIYCPKLFQSRVYIYTYINNLSNGIIMLVPQLSLYITAEYVCVIFNMHICMFLSQLLTVNLMTSRDKLLA